MGVSARQIEVSGDLGFLPHTEDRIEIQRAACRHEDLLMLDELKPEKVPIKISPMDQTRTGFHLLSP